MTTKGDPKSEPRSRLNILPPSASSQKQTQIDTVVESTRREKAKKAAIKSKVKRKLRTEPLAVAPESFPESTGLESNATGSSRKPLPIAGVPTRDLPLEELDGANSEILYPADVVPPEELATTLPVAERGTSEEQLEAIQHWHDEVQAQPVSLFDQVAKFMSGWATSFVIHTMLIIAFALLTFGLPQDPKIMLSLDNVDVERMDTETFEVSVDFDPIQESSVSELEDTVPEELSDEFNTEMLDANEVLTEMEDFGMETLSGEGVGSKMGDGGAQMAAADGKKGVAGESVDFFGSYAKGKRFVFVIDCSGSMMGERWQRAKYELERSIGQLGSDQRFCVVLYNSGTQVMMNNKKVEMLAANTENRERVSKWLNRQYPNGGTYPRHAVMNSLEAEPDAIFLLSDGEIQDNTREFLLAKNRNRDNGQGDYGQIPVHTIALLSTFGQQMLRTIADDNGGTFTRVGRR